MTVSSGMLTGSFAVNQSSEVEIYKRVLNWTAGFKARRDIGNLQEIISQAFMESWLESRLNGRDPILPVNKDDFEAPEQLFIDIWLATPPGNPVRHYIGSACDSLLSRLWVKAPEPWETPLLALVGSIRPEQCRRLLFSVVRSRAFTWERRDLGLDIVWLNTASSYDLQAPDLIRAWASLLTNDRYTSIAFRALAHDPELGVWYLPAYYSALPTDQRDLLLREAVRLIAEHGAAKCIAILQTYGSHLTAAAGLPRAIGEALRDIGLPEVLEVPASKQLALPEEIKGGHETSKYADIATIRPNKTRIAA